MNRKIVIGVAGSSGSIYTKVLFEQMALLKGQWSQVGVVLSKNALINWELELGAFSPDQYPFDFYEKSDFYAPFASGSARYDTMIVCPCSMGTLGRIASGVSDDLMTRAADVILKERRRLILVPRETPLSLIHLRNMVQVTEAGGIIAPASPSFYGGAKTVEDMARTVVDRVLDLAGFDLDTYRWSEGSSSGLSGATGG
ncbi:MAG: UbiX family flavin prenyltransferase [Saprospiraceae bacterium]|nr:UbiX family flavin prenyltransferase [Saprospiraceae bacterium]